MLLSNSVTKLAGVSRYPPHLLCHSCYCWDYGCETMSYAGTHQPMWHCRGNLLSPHI